MIFGIIWLFLALRMTLLTHKIFYVGTGEGYGNTDATLGGGIWKTSDGGTTWKRFACDNARF